MGVKRVRSAVVLQLVFGIAATVLSCGNSAAGDRSAQTQASRLETLDLNLQSVEVGDKSAPRDRWDPDYVVNGVGRDPRALFAWVRRNTWWIAYRGVLRGPVGVLMDGQGNSLDRSLLLATLLQKAGHSARLAHGELSREQAGALLPDLVSRQATPFAASGDTDTELAKRLQTTAAQFIRGEVGAARVPAAPDIEGILSRLDARVIDQTKRLLRAVNRPDLAEDWRSRLSIAVAALQNHWWVQRRNGNGWVDMDLLSADGASLTAATETIPLEDIAAAVPHHEIALRVIAEQWSSGVLAERLALEQVLRPADLIGQSVVLQFWPTAPITGSDQADAAKSDYRSVALDQREWAAVLLTGRMTLNAAVLPESGDDPDAPKGGPMAALAGGFGGAFQTSRARSSSSEHRTLSAVWLEYEIRVPGEQPRTVRRTVFDLVGPAARANGASVALTLNDSLRLARSSSLTMRTEILPLACQIAPEFVTHLIAESLLGNRELLHGAAYGNVAPGSSVALDLTERSAPTVNALYALALARQANDQTGRTYIDRPALLTSHSYPKVAGTGVTIVEATDVVVNHFGVSLAVPDAFEARVAQGVRDTNAEALLRGPGALGNAADAYAARPMWITLTSPDETVVDGLKLPADMRRRILDELNAGYVVVVPQSPVPMKAGPFAGWWRIEPATGNTLGFGDNGWGVATSEYSANSGRGGAAGRLFINASKRFVAGFAGMYGWCLAPLIQHRVGDQGLKLGLQLAAADSVGECVGDAIFVGALATLPLVVLTTNRGARAPMPPEPPSNENAGPTKTKPLPDAKTHPDLSDTQPDLSDTSPDLSKTSPDRSKTQYDPNSQPAEPEPKQPRTRPKTVAEAAENLAQARQRMLETREESFRATGEFVRYRASEPNPAQGYEGDPAFNPEVDKALEAEASQKSNEAVRALNEWKQAQRDLRDLEAANRRAAGKSGL